MSTVMQSARGASAFTESAPSYFLASNGGSLDIWRTEKDLDSGWTQWIDALLRMRNLENDWDGEGSEAPHPNLVDGAITLAQYLESIGEPPADRVIASVNGTIYFEWHTPLEYREIEVTSPLDAEDRRVKRGSNETVVVRLTRHP